MKSLTYLNVLGYSFSGLVYSVLGSNSVSVTVSCKLLYTGNDHFKAAKMGGKIPLFRLSMRLWNCSDFFS